MPAYREDQALISVQLGGVTQFDPEDTPLKLPATIGNGWTGIEGGDLSADDVKTRPGGMASQLSLGGPTTRSDCTVTTVYSSELDAIYAQMESMCGKRSMAVSWTLLDPDGNKVGATNTIHGILKSVSRPNFNANTTAAGMLTLVMSCHV